MPGDFFPNLGAPKVLSGPRALFKISGQTIGYASNVSGEETIKSVA